MGINVARGVEQKPGSSKKNLTTREYKQQREEEKRMELELETLSDQLGAIKSDLTNQTREQEELDRQAQEAEAMLQSSPEVTPPTLLNYKELKKQHELLKTALANKRAVESRLLESEAERNKLAKELCRSQILLNQERIERGSVLEKERRLIEHLEQEKQGFKATNHSLQDFLGQP